MYLHCFRRLADIILLSNDWSVIREAFSRWSVSLWCFNASCISFWSLSLDSSVHLFKLLIKIKVSLNVLSMTVWRRGAKSLCENPLMRAWKVCAYLSSTTAFLATKSSAISLNCRFIVFKAKLVWVAITLIVAFIFIKAD